MGTRRDHPPSLLPPHPRNPPVWTVNALAKQDDLFKLSQTELAGLHSVVQRLDVVNQTYQQALNHAAATMASVLSDLEAMTSDDFAKGADRPIRKLLAETLQLLGAASPEQITEYLS